MLEDLVSVIIPVYNVENYLEKCVESVINQSYQNIEILLINDGSTDSSANICNLMKKKDSRIKVFHKKNGGLSDARNYGINESSGKYLVFIDSDDWVDKEYVRYLYDLINNNDCDISVCEIVKITEKGKIVSNNLNNNNVLKLNQKDALKNMIEVNLFATSACGKMYKRECFDAIKFPVGRLFEDIPTNYSIFLSVENVIFGARGLYYYLTREGSITRKKFSAKNMDSIIFIEEAMKKVLIKYPEFENISNSRVFLAYFDIWKSFGKKDIDSEYYINTKSAIKNLRRKIKKSKKIDNKVRKKILLTYLPLWLVKMMFYLLKK